MGVAGVDVGGTNIEVGLIGDDHDVLDRAKRRTPRDGPDAVVTAIAEMVGSLDGPVEAVGVGIPGVVDDGEVVVVPNLTNWTADVDLVALLGAALDIPIAVGNDVNAGLLGEWVAGAAQGYDDVLGVWMGTGIGGALVLGGRLFTGSAGAAGELGHMIVRANGALCGCGRRGCVEAYAGRRSMATSIQAMVDAGRSTTLFELQEELGASRPTSKVWTAALAGGDPLATEIFDEGVEALGMGIASAINLIDVELVVIGGGLAERMGIALTERVAAASAPYMMRPHPDLAWVPAELGDDAGVVGAAAIARAEL